MPEGAKKWGEKEIMQRCTNLHRYYIDILLKDSAWFWFEFHGKYKVLHSQSHLVVMTISALGQTYETCHTCTGLIADSLKFSQ